MTPYEWPDGFASWAEVWEFVADVRKHVSAIEAERDAALARVAELVSVLRLHAADPPCGYNCATCGAWNEPHREDCPTMLALEKAKVGG